MDKTERGSVQPFTHTCQICHALLVVTSRKLAGIYAGDEREVELHYHSVLVCPKRRGLWMLFFLNHDRCVVRDDGTAVVLQLGEVELIM